VAGRVSWSWPKRSAVAVAQTRDGIRADPLYRTSTQLAPPDGSQLRNTILDVLNHSRFLDGPAALASVYCVSRVSTKPREVYSFPIAFGSDFVCVPPPGSP